MVWSFLLDSTICWQRTEEGHYHSYIAAQTGLSKRAVETAVVTLRRAGLIAYEEGRPSPDEGRNLRSRFTILHVRDVLGDEVPHVDATPLPHTDVAPLSHGDVAPVPHGDVAPPDEGPPLPHGHVAPCHILM